MSHQASSWVAECSQHGGSELLVFLIIANHCHSDGTGAWPSFQTIASESRMSVRGVRYIIEKLEKSGELVVKRTKWRNGQDWEGRNEYSIPGVVRDGFHRRRRTEASFACATEAKTEAITEQTFVPKQKENLDSKQESEQTLSVANLPVLGLSESQAIPKPTKSAKKNGNGRWQKPEPIQRYGATDESAAALAYAQSAFLSKTGHPPFWNEANVESLHALFGKFPIDLAEFSRRWDIFLASDDPFDLKQGFSLIWFCRNPDRYIQRVVAKSKREKEIERSDESIDRWLQGKQNERKLLGSS